MMIKKIFTISMGMLVVATAFAGQATAFSSCAAANIRWASSSNTVYISGDVECTLTQLKQLGSKFIPLTLVDSENKTWFLGANLFLQEGAKLTLHGSSIGGDVNELRLKSNNGTSNDFIKIRADWGTIDIDSTKITSWDEAAGGPDTEFSTYQRAFIHVRSRLGGDGDPKESRMDIANSDIGYLGFQGAEAYGLTWKVSSGSFADVGVFGDVANNKIHHNHFGIYTYGAEAMTFQGNEVYENNIYGIDPHDDSDYLIIDGNNVHHNGKHGIICSQRCNNLTITNNTSSNNGGNGIMLHRNVNDSLVENNEMHDNIDTGIAIFDSYRNTVRNNTAKGNSKGIRLSVGSSNNVIENNDFSENLKYGIYFFKGSDVPTNGGDGRLKSNTFEDNTVNANGSTGAKIQQADTNIFKGNSFTNNGNYPFETTSTNGNRFEANITTSNVPNYYFVKSTSANTVQDTGSFALKIGDTASSMTVIDSENGIYKNDKNLATVVDSASSKIIANRSNLSTSIVAFTRLDFTVTPSTASLTIKPLIWNTSGDFAKKWTAISSSSGSITASHHVGNLEPGTTYKVTVNGSSWQSFVANGDGEIDFDYTNTFQSTKTFEVKE